MGFINGYELDYENPLARGLVGWWPLNGLGHDTLALDYSGNGNHGKLNNFTYDGTTNGWTAGKFGQGLMFNGTNQYITVGNVLHFAIGSSITLSYWGTIATNNAYHKAISKNSGSLPSNRNYEFGFNNANGVTFLYVKNDAYNIWDSSSAYTDAAWHFYAVTYSFGTGGSIKVYRDGVPISGTWTSGAGNDPLPTDTEPLCIGSSQEYWPGSLDDVRIYNRALSAAEVWCLYMTNPFDICIKEDDSDEAAILQYLKKKGNLLD